MREIASHHDGHGLNEALIIEADDIGAAGASHHYTVKIKVGDALVGVADIQFQRGPRNDPASRPGILDSVLLAIVADRMECFNKGEYSCRENAIIKTKVEEALHWMKHRADDRARRNVLGTYAK